MKDLNYIKLVILHLLIGLIIFIIPVAAKLYAFSILILGIYYVVKNKNKNFEVLQVIAYIVGSEVFLRGTGGSPNYEFAKYSMVLFCLIGFCFQGFSKKAYPYIIFLLLLIPSIIIRFESLQNNIRHEILFNISGSVSLGICALYTYKRKITSIQLNSVLIAIGLPIIAFSFFLFLKCPLGNFTITCTESNYTLSGGIAPNQTATILGLGIFIFTIRFFLTPISRIATVINILLLSYVYYRTLLTLSRGGTITGIAIVLLFFVSLLIYNNRNRVTLLKISAFIALFTILFLITSYQTNQILLKRYENKNPSGLYKGEEINGREDIALNEIETFTKNPFTGVGLGNGKKIRKSELKLDIASHNEITRMLAEQGIFGIISLLILIVCPIFLLLKNKRNIFILSFFGFWFLTINHSGMRIAAPAFLYGLSLLCIEFKNDLVEKEQS